MTATQAPDKQRHLQLDDCREFVATELFPLRPQTYAEKYPKWPGAVGLEVEMLPVNRPLHPGDTPSLVPLHKSQSSLSVGLEELAQEQSWHREYGDDGLLLSIKMDKGDFLTFEPGGQLEFSSVPYPCLSEAVCRLREVQGLLRAKLALANRQLVCCGINPWYSVEQVGLQMRKKRYLAMDAYFSRIGPFGQRMMRQSCSIQVCLDFGPSEETLVQRFLLAQLLAPFAAATFANSGYVDHKPAGIASFRTRIWRHVDKTRTGFPQLERIVKERTKDSCIDAYLNFLLDAQVIYVEKLGYAVPTHPLSFRQWVLGGYEGVYPNRQDFLTHASLHFPEVRPRGFLELRSVDGQAEEWQAIPAAFYTGLLYAPAALQERTLAYLLPFHRDLDELIARAENGLVDPTLRAVAQQLMAWSCEGFEQLPPCFRGEGIERALKIFAERYTFMAKTPADEGPPNL